jgi:DNA polymerase (family 10)
VLERLRYMYDAGARVLLKSAIADLPADLRGLYESGAVTIAQLAALHRAAGVLSAADLRAELADGAGLRAAGIDAATEDALRLAAATLQSGTRLPLGRALALADPLVALRRETGIDRAELVGSIRRGQDLVSDIEILAPVRDPAAALAKIVAYPDVARCLHRGARRAYVLIDRVQVGVRCPEPDVAGASLLYHTGSAAHIDALRARASGRGWTLTPSGLRRAQHPPVAASEDAIYDALGLPFVPPELREGADEVAAAAAGRLPVLVSRSEIRGDLHMHTQYSDGRDTVDAMVRASTALGYEYIAITDHSPHTAASRSLSADAVARQADEIAALREHHKDIVILHGCEVDILRDGRLDFSDRVLSRFDIVLASLHDDAGDPPERLLRRYTAAMRHPLVTVITHPTNRLLPYKPGYDLDYDRLFEMAVETRTVLEIDGGPTHLDLDAARARRAVAAGVVVSIDSDCHRAELLDRQMRLGLLTARRGWVEARHVLNTRPIADVRAVIARKRAG